MKIIEAEAYIWYQVIQKDNQITTKEKEAFISYFTQTHNLTQNEVTNLLNRASKIEGTLETHIDTINTHYQNNLLQKANLLQKLNEAIYKDGIADAEYEVFEEVRNGLV